MSNNMNNDNSPNKNEKKNRTKIKSNSRIVFYKKGEKGRQQYLVNNISCVTAFICAKLSDHFNFIISFPIKLSTHTTIFPRMRTLFLDDEEEIPINEITEKRIELLKKELMVKNPEKKYRMNFTMHYELYHLLFDLLYLVEDIEIINEIEEPSGLSGDYKIRINEREYKWEDIKKIGEQAIERMYSNRKTNEKRRLIKRGSLSDLFI